MIPKSPTLAMPLDIEAARAELARRSLRHFVRQAWKYADPAPFVDTWAVGAICEHLEACASRQIRRLLINVPPRHSKSLLTSVFFPAWLWIDRPQERILSASYGISLSRRDSRLARQVIRSAWYQENFGASFKVLYDQDEKADYENDRGGKRIATSVGGMGTGAGGSFIIVDDPHNAVEINSDLERNAVIDWWNQTMSTRLDDPDTGVQIVIMQRLHAADLSGEILRAGGWEHLRLPARFEAERRCTTSIGWSDPRTADGQLLSPERFNEAAVAEIETRLGSFASAGQLQQRPAPAEGGRIKKAWFKSSTSFPSFERIVLSVDCGNKTKAHNDPTACGVWGKFANEHHRIGEWRERVDFPGLKAGIIAHCAKYNPAAVLIEDAANGTPLIQQLRIEPGFVWPIIAVPVTRDKITRLDSASPMIEAGMVWLPQYAPWVADYVEEMTTFPNGAHDDRVDETSMYLNWARGGRDFDEVLQSLAINIRESGGGRDYDRDDYRDSPFPEHDNDEMENW